MAKKKAESVTFTAEISGVNSKPVVDTQTAARSLVIDAKLRIVQDSSLLGALSRLEEESQVRVTIEAVQGNLEI